MTTGRQKTNFPLFQLYKLDDLERLLCVPDERGKPWPYSVEYLFSIRQGRQVATRHFRNTVAQTLGHSVEDLFGPTPEEEQS